MIEQYHKLKTYINGANTTLLIFAVLCLFYINFIVSGNEEIYLGWAKAYYNPNWIPNSFVYDHWVGHRYLFEIFFGFLLNHLTFELVVAIGRILAAGALAYSLAKLFKQIKFTNLESLLVVVVFISCGQNILPGEFIFMSVESKVFAYPLIFLAITELLKGNLKTAALYIVGATYFHVIVAGWFFIYYILYLTLSKFPPRKLLQTFGVYLVGTLPLIAFLAPKVLSGPSDVNRIHLNWIYVFYRIPNLAPFVDGKLNTSAGWEILEILTVAAFFLISVFIKCKLDISRNMKLLNDFILIIGTFIFTFLVIGYFDRTGDILKYRPFRGDSLFLLLFLIETVLLSKQFLTQEKVINAMSKLSLALTAILIIYGTGRNIANKYIDPYFLQDKYDQAWSEVLSFAINKTEKGSVFLVKGIREKIYWSFSRQTDRDLFVLFKFNPIDKSKWFEWYQRLQISVENEKQMAELKKRYKLDYYITVPSRPKIGKVVFENSQFVISHLPSLEKILK